MNRLVVTLRSLCGRLAALFYSFFTRKKLCGCGHWARKKTFLNIHGHKGLFTLNKKKNYCPDCFAKASIKCAWCGETIFPGSPITLYTPVDQSFQVPEGAVIYRHNPLQLVGCLRWNCANSGIDRAGFWVMPGIVRRVLSPMEMIIGGHTKDGIVIINNISDPKEAIHIPEGMTGNPKNN